MGKINIFEILFYLIGFSGAFALVCISPVIIRKTLNKILVSKRIIIFTKIFLWYFFIGGAIGIITTLPNILGNNTNIGRIETFGTFSMCLGICLGTGLRLFKK